MRKTFWTLVILFVFNFLCCKSPADPEIEKALEELKEARITISISPNPLVVEPSLLYGAGASLIPMTIRFTEHEGVSAQLYNFGYEVTIIGTNSTPSLIDFDDGKLDANGSLEFFEQIYIWATQEPCEVEVWGQFTDENGHDIEAATYVRVEPYT